MDNTNSSRTLFSQNPLRDNEQRTEAFRPLRCEQNDASLAESAAFCIDVCLRGLTPEQAQEMLRRHGPDFCRAEGIKQIRTMVRSAELLYLSDLRQPLPILSKLLSAALYEGLGGFFQRYDPESGAHELPFAAGYPVLFYPIGFRGIDFLRRYLDNLVTENRFLRYFPPHAVQRCLSMYALRRGTTPADLDENLFLIVLACALRAQPGCTARDYESAGTALAGRLRCSGAVRSYILRACREYTGDIARIHRQMDPEDRAVLVLK